MHSPRPTAVTTDIKCPQTYYDHVDIFDYDETIVAHPYMDQVKAAIVADLIALDVRGKRQLTILDAGTGSGQLARSMLGAGFSKLDLADVDRHSEKFCRDHPELSRLPFHKVDLAAQDLRSLEGRRFDVVCLLGVYHHIQPVERVAFLRNIARVARYIVIGDEGIQEYSSESERKRHARAWYGFVIAEAKRRGIQKLALLEEQFMQSDIADVRAPEDDYKESPSVVFEYAHQAGLGVVTEKRIGDWARLKGGMYTATFTAFR